MGAIDNQKAKTRPHSIEAEQAVLGNFLIAGDDWSEDVLAKLSAQDFYRTDHQLIFKAIDAVLSNSQTLDVLILTEALRKRDALEGAGGVAYLVELAEHTIGAEHVDAYADIIVNYSRLRQLLTASQQISALVYDSSGLSVTELLDQAEKKIFAIAEQGRFDDNAKEIDGLLSGALGRIEILAEMKGQITGLPTGYADIDKLTDGLHPGELVVVAGRPSMGKTSLAINIVEHVIIKSNPLPIVVFSLEMPAISLVMRILASLARVNQRHVATGFMTDDDWPRIGSAASLLREKPLFIDDSSMIRPNDIRMRCRRLAREHGDGKLSLIVVDYIQLMQPDRVSRDGSRVSEISDISRALKALAKEMDCPVIALSQLNRALEQRQNKRPAMADLRDSGAIEQDADLIMFIYRDEVYNAETEDKGIAEIIIGKQRNGPIGTCKLAFLPQLTRFESLDPHGETMGELSTPVG